MKTETLDLSPVGRDGMMLQRLVLCAQLLDATICIFKSLLNELLDGLLSDLDETLTMRSISAA